MKPSAVTQFPLQRLRPPRLPTMMFRVKRAGSDPRRKLEVNRSFNSWLRCAKSLFREAIICRPNSRIAIEQAVTRDSREALAARLNRDLKDFKPEVVLAEECAHLLKTAPGRKFSNLTVRSDPVLMAGGESLLKNDTIGRRRSLLLRL